MRLAPVTECYTCGRLRRKWLIIQELMAVLTGHDRIEDGAQAARIKEAILNKAKYSPYNNNPSTGRQSRLLLRASALSHHEGLQ